MNGKIEWLDINVLPFFYILSFKHFSNCITLLPFELIENTFEIRKNYERKHKTSDFVIILFLEIFWDIHFDTKIKTNIFRNIIQTTQEIVSWEI